MLNKSYITPIHYLDCLYGNPIYVKRDDLIPYSFGGNKARKAINFFKEIDAGNYDCVVTYGSSSSNHCRIVSNMAAARKMSCYIIGPEEVSKPTFNSRMMELFGAEIIIVPVEKVHDMIEEKLKVLRGQGWRPYFIAGGGHGNLGTQAYVECYEEIKQFEKEQRIHFNYIFLASGTGTTQAGLVCGQLIYSARNPYSDEKKIIGISIARKNPRGRQIVLDSVREWIDEKKSASRNNEIAEIDKNIVFIDDYVGHGYGKDSPEIRKLIRDSLVCYGLPLDSTYTAKAFYGMRQYLKKQDLSGKNILFIHTGGTPLFFDDISRMI